MRARFAPFLLSALLLAALVPTAHANPVVPYCGVPDYPVANAPGADLAAACKAATGRVFPEASSLSVDESCAATTCHGVATDYVSYPEFQAGLRYLASQYPDYLTVHEVAKSFGLCPVPSPGATPVSRCTGALDHFPIYMLEITNKKSPLPIEKRQAMLFMLSIHGVEKGGREGGMRVLEDLVSNFGFATETVQNGAGLPTAIARPGGGEVKTYRDYLDFQRIFLLFPNADGWMHDEVPYVVANPPSCGSPPNGVLFCRTNGNGIDLNRQAPTLGWQDPSRDPVGEPESIGYYNWMLTQGITWAYAIDIHGMLQHQNFAAIMMPAGSFTPQEMQRSVRLAETLKERANEDPHFANWKQLFTAGEGAEDTACTAANECFTQGALGQAGSSTFAEYYTVIDAIGYTDSGFNGDYFAQNSGLNAPGYDIELAYNHITTESQYEGPGSVFNDFHVKMVREIVKSFMDAAALDVKISFETHGKKTLYVEPSFIATNLDDIDAKTGQVKGPGGWADENPGDDLWDYGKNGGFRATPARYWEDLKPFVRSGAEPGVLTKTTASKVTSDLLRQFDTFVIPGSAIKDLERDNAGAIAAIKAWVEGGGNLVLTDEGLRFLDLAGITSKAVDVKLQYMGGLRMDLSKPVFYAGQDNSKPDNQNVRGGVKQTYEPTPLGFEEGANAAPNWFVSQSAFKGDAWGITCGTTNIGDPCTGNGVGLGDLKLGSGRIQFIGSLLPDPTEEFYHPYGLDDYATTYSGNQILRNMLGWDNVFAAPPVVINDSGIVQSANEPPAGTVVGVTSTSEAAKGTPALGLPLALAALAVAAVALRRRR
ncbi:MAG TPA: hypothetical protein VM286_02080 [Candidatus Thermoplasmatota archaeon]|nr:hypothetical protein [Candidatus Thermoplasmatota archaeon]